MCTDDPVLPKFDTHGGCIRIFHHHCYDDDNCTPLLLYVLQAQMEMVVDCALHARVRLDRTFLLCDQCCKDQGTLDVPVLRVVHLHGHVHLVLCPPCKQPLCKIC